MTNSRLRRTLGIGALVLALGTGLTGCEKVMESHRQKEPKRIELKVGEYKQYLQMYIQYAGMNNEKTFSLSGMGNWAVNLYYPIKSKEVNFFNEKLKVIDVNSEHIILERE